MLVSGALLLGACHRTTDVRGIYVNQDSSGTLFPCTDANAAVLVPDRALAMRYFATVKPSEAGGATSWWSRSSRCGRGRRGSVRRWRIR